MSDYTPDFTTIQTSQSGKEVTANRLHAAALTMFGIERWSGLVVYFIGGRVGGTHVAAGNLTMTNAASNYVVAHRTTLALSVSTGTTNWNDNATYGRVALITAASGVVSNWEDRRFGANGIFDFGSTPAFIVLSPAYAASLTIDLAACAEYAIVVVNVGTLTGNITLNITNGADGQVIRVRLTQDGTGNRTFTAGANLRFSTDTPSPTLTTTANKMDRLGFEWHASAGKADLVAVNKGY